MRKAKTTSPGVMTRTTGKTSVASTMKPIFSEKGRSSAKRLKGRPMTGR